MVDEIQTAISALERAIQQKRDELARLEQALETVRRSTGREPAARSAEYAGLGITEAAKRYLAEIVSPQSTAEIAKELRARGVVTKSKNFVPTVYSTLTNNKDFARHEGRWILNDLVLAALCSADSLYKKIGHT
jgi:hypothetical protein